MLDQISDFSEKPNEWLYSIVNSKDLWVSCNFLHLQVYRCCVLQFETCHSVWSLGSVGLGLSFLVVCVHSCPLSFLIVCLSPPFMSDFETTDLLVWNKKQQWMNEFRPCLLQQFRGFDGNICANWTVFLTLNLFAMCRSSAGQFDLKMSAVGENPLGPATPESRKRRGSPCDTSGQR